MNDQEWNQINLERQQMVEEALIRLESHQASETDRELVWFECGLGNRFKQLKGNTHEHHRQ